MKMRLAFAATLALAGASAWAHHSFAMFDNKTEMTLVGTVKEFQWTNPHSWVQLIVTDPNGNPVEWSIEGGSVAALSHQGWTPATFTPGEKVEVIIHPLKDGRAGGSLIRAIVKGQKIGNGWDPVRKP